MIYSFMGYIFDIIYDDEWKKKQWKIYLKCFRNLEKKKDVDTSKLCWINIAIGKF